MPMGLMGYDPTDPLSQLRQQSFFSTPGVTNQGGLFGPGSSTPAAPKPTAPSVPQAGAQFPGSQLPDPQQPSNAFRNALLAGSQAASEAPAYNDNASTIVSSLARGIRGGAQQFVATRDAEAEQKQRLGQQQQMNDAYNQRLNSPEMKKALGDKWIILAGMPMAQGIEFMSRFGLLEPKTVDAGAIAIGPNGQTIASNPKPVVPLKATEGEAIQNPDGTWTIPSPKAPPVKVAPDKVREWLATQPADTDLSHLTPAQAKDLRAFVEPPKAPPTADWQLQPVQPDGSQVMFNTRTGEVKPAPIAKGQSGSLGSSQVQRQKASIQTTLGAIDDLLGSDDPGTGLGTGKLNSLPGAGIIQALTPNKLVPFLEPGSMKLNAALAPVKAGALSIEPQGRISKVAIDQIANILPDPNQPKSVIADQLRQLKHTLTSLNTNLSNPEPMASRVVPHPKSPTGYATKTPDGRWVPAPAPGSTP